MRAVLADAGLSPRAVVSVRSKAYRERPAEIDALSDDELLAAMVAEPTLIRRPLVVSDGRAVTGFDRQGLQALVEGAERNG